MKRLALLVLVPSLAHASYHRRTGPAPIRMELTVGAERMNYGNAMFTGHPRLEGRSLGTLKLAGKSFGARTMGLLDTALHIEGITHHVVAGVGIGFLYGGLNRGPGLDADPVHASGAERVQTGSSLSGMYVGPTIGTAWTWKAFDLAITTTIGYRTIGVSLHGFDTVSCGRGGRCEPSASNDSFFAQPRIAMGVHHNTWGMGGYFGGDLTPSASGWSTGLYFDIADGMFRQRASATSTAPSGGAR